MKKSEIMYIKFNRLIQDPFPEHTQYQQVNRMYKPFHKPPEDISIWKAYRMGYEKAYSEILEKCDEE